MDDDPEQIIHEGAVRRTARQPIRIQRRRILQDCTVVTQPDEGTAREKTQDNRCGDWVKHE